MIAQPLELSVGPARLVLRPDLGGSIQGLWLGDLPIMQSHASGALTDGVPSHAAQCASYPLVPYSNRIAHAQLQWQGQRYALAPNFAPEPHTIHGVGWQRAWAVQVARHDFAHLVYAHAADADWPFALDAWQTFALTENSSGTTLTLALGMTNRASVPAPAGLGWHPYFVKRAQSRIAFEAAGRWEMDENKLPSTWSAAGGLDADCSALDVDHCFDQWRGAVLLRDECMLVRLRSDVQRLVVYTTPSLPMLAIEPVSHVNNAMNHADSALRGVQTLQPGQSYAINLTLELNTL